MHKVLAENWIEEMTQFLGSKYFIVGKAGGEGRAPAEPKSGGGRGGDSQIAVTEDEHLISNYCNILIFYQDFLLFFP